MKTAWRQMKRLMIQRLFHPSEPRKPAERFSLAGGEKAKREAAIWQLPLGWRGTSALTHELFLV